MYDKSNCGMIQLRFSHNLCKDGCINIIQAWKGGHWDKNPSQTNIIYEIL